MHVMIFSVCQFSPHSLTNKTKISALLCTGLSPARPISVDWLRLVRKEEGRAGRSRGQGIYPPSASLLLRMLLLLQFSQYISKVSASRGCKSPGSGDTSLSLCLHGNGLPMVLITGRITTPCWFP